MTDIRITYETLFDLLRREKNREELQTLDMDFYEQVLAYIIEKKQVLLKKGDELFVSAEKEKLKIQFQNIRRIIKELYERREKKIINLAMNKARTGSNIIDLSTLLPSEKRFFEEQVSIFIRYKEEVLNKIIHLKEIISNNEKPIQQKKPEKTFDTKSNISTPAIHSQQKTKKIKILIDLPRFAVTDHETIGPFNKGDTAEINSSIASLLVKKGNAEEC